MKTTRSTIQGFNFKPGRILAKKYEVISFLGGGWEGEVYKVREVATGIERAVKLFFPHRNQGNRTAKFYAKKLHKLRHCTILIQYHTQEMLTFKRHSILFLVSEFVEGELLNTFLAKQPGKRLQPFEALHLLHTLATGVEQIHEAKEYHGDLHDENIIIRRQGLQFKVKLVDMYNWGKPSGQNILDDVCDLVRVFYDTLGGARYYAKHPQYVKDICCGLKRTLISGKFRTAGQLRSYLENFIWDR